MTKLENCITQELRVVTWSKYLVFYRNPNNQNPKTEVWEVITKGAGSEGGILLGYIRWYANWRQYGFYPQPETVFERQCLGDITSFTIHCNEYYHKKEKALIDRGNLEQDYLERSDK